MSRRPVLLGVRARAVLSCLLFGSAAYAQDRPSEADMFGGTPPAPSAPRNAASSGTPPPTATPGTGASEAPSAPPTTAAAPVPAAAGAVGEPAAPNPSPGESRDSQVLGATSNAMFSEEAAPEDPLKLGGQLYLRAQTTGSRGQELGNWSFSAPSLLDVYLDARPNDRVRGFVLGRMTFDPTLPTSASSSESSRALSATGSTAGSQSLSSLFQQPTRGPTVSLDQLWLRFDVAHTVFVTAGKQHVRWGTGHFWAPSDFLHLRPRNPLDVFDARTGTTMLKLHLPIESKAWNFYGYLLTESTGATSTLGSVAAATRAELVLGPAELGLGVFAKRSQKPKFASDLSFGIGDFDFYGELALRSGNEIDRVRYDGAAMPADPGTPPSWETPDQAARDALTQIVDAYYPVYRSRGFKPQVVAGTSYAQKYNDNDTFTLGAEYFYNALGYGSPVAYPGLVLPHSVSLNDSANFFYLGRHYAALYVSFPAPFSFDNHTFTLSTLGNLSDRSFITRFDYSLVALTHLRFEAFVSARYGNENGEFRFGVSRLVLGGIDFTRAPALMDMGVALRIAI
jgi:hypothetical protein